jgi:hypothetical protein
MDQKDAAAAIPAEVWGIVLSYACPIDQDAPGFHPLDSESRLLNSVIQTALYDRLTATVLTHREGASLALRPECSGHVGMQIEGSLYSQKRTVIALCDAPSEMLWLICRVEGNFFSGSTKGTERHDENPGLKILGASLVIRLLERLTNLSYIEGPFLRFCTWLKVVDLRHMVQLKEIGLEFLSFSSVEEVY